MYEDVTRFILACDQEKTVENVDLYKNLIKEEYEEFIQATNDTDELDACMDMIWVILGYCYMKGWKTSQAWKEVSRSNLAKINPVTGKVVKDENGKVMKPQLWTPPQLEQYTK